MSSGRVRASCAGQPPRRGRAEAIEELAARLGEAAGLAWIAPGWRPVWDGVARAVPERDWILIEAPWWGELPTLAPVDVFVGCGLLSGPDPPSDPAAWRDRAIAAAIGGRGRALLLEDRAARAALGTWAGADPHRVWRRASLWEGGAFALATASRRAR